MSSRDRKTRGITGAVMILLLLTFFTLMGIGPFYGRIFAIIFVFFISLSLIVFVALNDFLRKTEATEPMVDPTTRSIYDEETTPKDIKSETPVFSCPDCGYMNPGDADFCIRCGQDLDLTDDVARY